MSIWTPVEIQVREKLLLLDPGVNTFNIQIDDLDGLIKIFTDHHARILRLECLDRLEAITPDPDVAAALPPRGVRVLPTK